MVPKPCLYCREKSGGFRAVEHVIPEFLGNKEIILQKGVVCDRCNNGPLSRLDAAIADIEALRIIRAAYGVAGKKGVRKSYRSAGMQLKNDGERLRMSWQLPDGGSDHSIGTPYFEGLCRSDVQNLSRALLKQLLGLICVDFGRKFCMQPEFDELRRQVLGRLDYSGFVIVDRRTTINPLLPANLVRTTVSYDFVHHGELVPVWVTANYFGFRLSTAYTTQSARLLPTMVPHAAGEDVVVRQF